MSKPINEYKKNEQSSNVDNVIKTAPDGRLIILDEPSEPLEKLSEFINHYIYSIIYISYTFTYLNCL